MKKKKIINLTHNTLSKDSYLKTKFEITQKIFNIMKNHIGEENYITPYDLFTEIYDKEPDYIDFFKRNYLWKLVKECITHLRSSGSVFIIMKKAKIFVLKTDEELKKFKQKTDRHIKALEESKKKATKWVKTESWKNYYYI